MEKQNYIFLFIFVLIFLKMQDFDEMQDFVISYI